MKRGWVFLIGMVLGGGVVLGERLIRPPVVSAAPDTVWIRDIIQSKARVDTTRLVIRKTTTLIDSLPGDTVFISKEVIREVLVECEACAAQLQRLAFIAESTRKVDRDSIARLNALLQRCGKQKAWYAAAGFGACAALGAAR